MLRNPTFALAKLASLIAVGLAFVNVAHAQVSGPPSANCHVTDGTFTPCPNGQTEWSDVRPLAFPASNSYLYVNQDASHTFLYLMYDLPLRTTPLAATDSVHINFDTVETLSGSPALVVYDIYIFGNGQMQVLQNGQPTPAGRIVGSAGFSTSPNSSTAHVLAELQVPMSAGPPSTYSPDPLFWGAILPPTPPPPPPPPACPPVGSCSKTQAEINAWLLAAASAEVLADFAHIQADEICTPLLETDPPVGIACFAGFAAFIATEMTIAAYDRDLAADPNDPNFTVIAVPAALSVPGFPITTPIGLSPQIVSDMNALMSTEEQIIALLQVIPVSINRANGASAAGNTFWYNQQAQAVGQYASQIIPLMKKRLALYAALTTDFATSGPTFTFSVNDVVNAGALPSAVTADLTALGLDATQQAAALNALFSVPPDAIAALGIGAFPQALSDPSFVATSNDAIDAFAELAAAAPHTYTVNQTVGIGSVNGTITTDGTIGTLKSSDILGWALTLNDGTNTLSISQASASAITQAPFPPSTDLTATASDLLFDFSSMDGGFLILGLTTVPGNGGEVTWESVGLGQNIHLFDLKGDNVFLTTPTLFGNQVIATATPGGSTAPVTTVTAAVVEANANGDTVANLRGLAPTDAPTLQDQIQMVVQFRVIQNPSTDAIQLTTQLVSSLPPTVLPPDQASNIINAVTKNLVPPPPVISGMPGPGCSLWPPNGKLVQVATVTATDAVGGLLPGSFNVTGTSNEPSDDPSNPEIVITPNGSGGYIVQLQARRLGTGTGRVYALTATASNSVGVTTNATATCTVPHDQGH